MSRVKGTKDRMRLAVFRSNRHIYAQIINDFKGVVITGVSSCTPELRKKKITNIKEISREVGKLLAKKAKEKKVSKIVFDRKNYKFHGSVKELAEGAREGGLDF